MNMINLPLIKRALNRRCRVVSLFLTLCFFHSMAFATVVTSIKPLGFIASAIADQVDEVAVIVPDGGSPHQYALKPSDVAAVNQADLVIWVGPELEGFMGGLLKKTQTQNQIAIADLVQVQPLLQKGQAHDHDDHDHAHHHGEYDMHLWLSPEIALQAAEAIHLKLLSIYPDKAQLLDDNLSHFKQRLNQTTETIANQLNNMHNKGYFVFHPAYVYFEDQFQLNHLGSITLNPSVQPGAKTVYEIRQKLKDEQAVCIFSEPQFDDRLLNKIVENSDVKIGKLDPLGINIKLNKDSYSQFLLSVSSQFAQCLQQE